jgi:hypothetical protein
MLTYKPYCLIALASLFALTGCMERLYNFDVANRLDNNAESFMMRLPGIRNVPYGTNKISVRAKQLIVYKATYKETYIEKDSLLEFTGLNDRSTIPRADYYTVDGSEQHLYLLHYQFKYLSEGAEQQANAAIFLSMRYSQDKKLGLTGFTGPGPMYWGLVNDGYISFDSVLTMKGPIAGCYLQANKPKKKYPFNLIFMPAVFAEAGEEEGSAITITKIVRTEPNRIGGFKPLVFNIPAIFGDSTALHFDYITTIPLK